MSARRPALVIHGGTGNRPDADRLSRIRQSLARIADETVAYLRTHCAIDAVAFAVTQLEDDPLFNAGTGSMLQRDGVARMSASIMDGESRRFAAVVNIEDVKNPVLVAQALLDRPDRVLACEGALAFARSLGFGSWDSITQERRERWQRQREGRHGTVGAVALDAAGRLAAATSTGGRGFELPGRVSDSGTPAGNFSSDRVAISCTGTGEDILDEALAVRIAQQIDDGKSLSRTASNIVRQLQRRKREAGFISLDRDGRWICRTTLPVLFAVARTPSRRAETF